MAIQSILVGVDFSEDAKNALDQALAIQKQFGSKVQVLHISHPKPDWADEVVTPLTLGYSAKNFDHLIHEAADLTMKKFLKIYEKKHQNLPYKITNGNIVESILKEAKEFKHDLIILGRRGHGYKDLSHAFLGSVANRVLRKTTIPTLIVPEKPKKIFKKILVPIDFHEASEDALLFAISMAKESNAKIIATHIAPPPYLYLNLYNFSEEIEDREHNTAFPNITEAAKVRLEDYLSPFLEKGVEIEKQVSTGRSWQHILTTADKTNTDIIVMGKSAHFRVERLLLGSTAENVLQHSELPVLVTP